MMRISLKQSHVYAGMFAALFLIVAAPAYAQTKQILSVTPPLFQMSAMPGKIWQSTIKVVNGNPYPMTVYAEVVNFKAVGESGHGQFLPIQGGDTEKTTLAHWIDIPGGPHLIPPETAKEISFFVDVPEDAPPGGHYAAVLITTKPSGGMGGGSAVQTSQAVTSLFFMRIEGDVHEDGSIREFRVMDTFMPRPEAEFSLRFENKGNVHLQPRGNIVITNMWGTERGIIPINYESHFGNVLPESIRDFKFTWQTKLSFTEVGRYKAIVTLGYGVDNIKNVSSVTYFWVVPVKITLIILVVLGTFIALIVWMVKAYIRRMLTLAGVPLQERDPAYGDETLTVRALDMWENENAYRKVSAPIRSGVLDLRQRLSTVEESTDVITAIWRFVVQYRYFFMSVLVLTLIITSAVVYIGGATEPNDDYQIIIDEGDVETTLRGGGFEEQ